MTRSLFHLHAQGVSLAILVAGGEARILHWGQGVTDADVEALAASDLPGIMFSSLDTPRTFGLIPTRERGWSGTPALVISADGAPVAHRLELVGATAEGDCVTVAWEVPGTARVEQTWSMHRSGVLVARGTVRSLGGAALDVHAFSVAMPLPLRASRIMDFTGRWTQERQPQSTPVVDGAHVRAVRRGRTGHDAPYLTMVGDAEPRTRHGQLWAAHVAWSGDHHVTVERLPEGAGVHGPVMLAGELLEQGEVRLAPGETYESPEVMWVYSGEGIDSISERLHGYVRAHAPHPLTPRPVTLNTWEAVYFDHDSAAISQLVRIASELGVERLVLDDGWFKGRRSDRAGLGDWEVDLSVWPHGLVPLSDEVHAAGMEFGLWVEPEMVNRDSDLARSHPEWILGGPHALEWRHQLALDLAVPEARAHVLERLDAVISEAAVDYVKWDHNRDLHVTASLAHPMPGGRERVRAVCSMMAELRRRHPRLEIESCASGGARIDLGIAPHVQRFWTSDSNDPYERQAIQRWTSLIIPPEMLGAHVGPERAHTTHRSSDLSFRMATALFGHAGIEWDVRECSEQERALLRDWISLHKELRPLIHSGLTVRGEHPDPGVVIHGVVAPDRGHAVFSVARTRTSAHGSTARVALPGLDPESTYSIVLRPELGAASCHEVEAPQWVASGQVMTGRVLSEIGLPLPNLNPGQAHVWEIARA